MPPRGVRSRSRRNTPSSPTKSAASPPTVRRATRATRSQSDDVDDGDATRARAGGDEEGIVESRGAGARKLVRADLATVAEEENANEEEQLATDESENDATSASSSQASFDPVEELASLDRDAIIDGLDTLLVDSRALLDFFPLSDAGALMGFIHDLESPQSRASKKLSKLVSRLNGSLESYRQDDEFIKPALIARKVSKLNAVEDIPAGGWRPDAIVQSANAAICLSMLYKCTKRLMATRQLTLAHHTFPALFASGIGRPDFPFASELYKESILLMLELRTQLTLSLLSARSRMPNFDPDDIMQQLWYTTTGLRSLTLGDAEDLDESFTRSFAYRISAIRKHFSQKVEDPVDFGALEEAFPWQGFLVQIALWMQKRRAEIDSQIENQGGVKVIQRLLQADDLQTETANSVAAMVPTDPRSPLKEIQMPENSKQPAPKAPLHIPLMAGSKKKTISGSMRVKQRRSELRDRQSRSALETSALLQNAIAGTPPSAQAQEEIPASPEPEETATTAVGDDDQAALPEPIVMTQQTVQVMRGLKRQEAQRNKENLNTKRGAIFQQQPDARRESPIDEDDIVRSARKPAQKRRFQQDEDEDEDEDFQEDTRPHKAHHRTNRPRKTTPPLERDESPLESPTTQRDLDAQLIQPSPQRPTTTSNYHGSPLTHRQNQPPALSATVPRRGPGRSRGSLNHNPPRPRSHSSQLPPHQPSQEPPPSTQAQEANRRAKITNLRANVARPVQVRTRWSEEEVDRLIALIEEHGTSWSKIMHEDSRHPEGALLQERGQVGLKDKARNIKIDYLRGRMELPVNFDAVTLGASNEMKLRQLGIAYGEDL